MKYHCMCCVKKSKGKEAIKDRYPQTSWKCLSTKIWPSHLSHIAIIDFSESSNFLKKTRTPIIFRVLNRCYFHWKYRGDAILRDERSNLHLKYILYDYNLSVTFICVYFLLFHWLNFRRVLLLFSLSLPLYVSRGTAQQVLSTCPGSDPYPLT